jgi:hypothetical protein
MKEFSAPAGRAAPPRIWPGVLAYAALVLAGLLLVAAGALWLDANSGAGWAWVGYYYAVGIAIFEAPALVLAIAALRGRRTNPRRGRVTASLAALLALGPLVLWGLWGLSL